MAITNMITANTRTIAINIIGSMSEAVFIRSAGRKFIDDRPYPGCVLQ